MCKKRYTNFRGERSSIGRKKIIESGYKFMRNLT